VGAGLTNADHRGTLRACSRQFFGGNKLFFYCQRPGRERVIGLVKPFGRPGEEQITPEVLAYPNHY
jgi:hypothetical protein